MLHPNVKLAASQIHGMGLVATRFIPHSTLIWTLDAWRSEFVYQEFLQQQPQIQLLCYCYHDKFMLVYDGGQFMNHCCDPNTGWLDDNTLISIRDIVAGDEVTYDYSTTDFDPRLRGTWRCNCGSVVCRSTITPYDCLSPAFQQKYVGLLPSWITTFIKQEQGLVPANHAKLPHLNYKSSNGKERS